MGMCVCCRQAPADSHPGGDGAQALLSSGKRDCKVACCGGSGDVQHFPYVMVCNSADENNTVHCFGKSSPDARNVAPRMPGEVLSLWHMKLYRTAIHDRPGKSPQINKGSASAMPPLSWDFWVGWDWLM